MKRVKDDVQPLPTSFEDQADPKRTKRSDNEQMKIWKVRIKTNKETYFQQDVSEKQQNDSELALTKSSTEYDSKNSFRNRIASFSSNTTSSSSLSRSCILFSF